jgi:hypothetical protein
VAGISSGITRASADRLASNLAAPLSRGKRVSARGDVFK